MSPTPSPSPAEPATTEAILATLQKAYDVVKANNPRTLALDDRLIDDLELDSLDLIDVVSVLEAEFSPDVVDSVIDHSSSIETVGVLVECLASASGPTSTSTPTS